MRSEGYSSRSVYCTVCLYCVCVYDYSRTTGYEAAYELYQQLQCYKNMAIIIIMAQVTSHVCTMRQQLHMRRGFVL